MKRRSFLQLIGLSPAIGAVPALPVEAKPQAVVEPVEPLKSVQTRHGMARYVVAYDIKTDNMICRLDVLTPDGNQHSCDIYVSGCEFHKNEIAPALRLLRDAIRHGGFELSQAVAPETGAWFNPAWRSGYVALS